MWRKERLSQFTPLLHEISSTPPQSSSTLLPLSVGPKPLIYSLHFWPRVMVFRFFKVACACARPENGKQTLVRHPLFLLNSNASWLFGLPQNSAMCSHYQPYLLSFFFWSYLNEHREISHYVSSEAWPLQEKVLTCFAVKALHVWATSD